MDTPLPEAVQPPSPAPKEHESTFVPAGVELIEHIGAGGMGAVYKARHAGIDATVAVKVLPPHVQADATSLQRFQREAKLLASLKHPNIVRVLSVASEGTQHALIMEHVEGVPLSAVLATDGALAPERAKKLISQTAKALSYAHGQKVAHRDLKPSNILVCNDAAGNETIKLIDFGIARALDETEQRLTRTGAVIGTPFYISPEQCSGSRGDERSDIYALGCILYECLTGTVPITGETAFEIMHKHLTEDPPHLTGELAKFDAVVHKAMAKNPADRYQSAKDFQDALEHGEKTRQPGSGFRRKPLFRADSRTLLAASALTVVLAIGLLVASLLHRKFEPPLPTSSSSYNKIRNEIVRNAATKMPPSEKTIEELKNLQHIAALGDFDDHRLCALALLYSYKQNGGNDELLHLEEMEWLRAIAALHRSHEISVFQPKRLAAAMALAGNLASAPKIFDDELTLAAKRTDIKQSDLAELHAGLAAVYDRLGNKSAGNVQRMWLVNNAHKTPEQAAHDTTFQVIEHNIRDDEKVEIEQYLP